MQCDRCLQDCVSLAFLIRSAPSPLQVYVPRPASWRVAVLPRRPGPSDPTGQRNWLRRPRHPRTTGQRGRRLSPKQALRNPRPPPCPRRPFPEAREADPGVTSRISHPCQPPAAFLAVTRGCARSSWRSGVPPSRPGPALPGPDAAPPGGAGAGARGGPGPAGQLRKLRSRVYKRGGQAWSPGGIEESRCQQRRGKGWALFSPSPRVFLGRPPHLTPSRTPGETEAREGTCRRLGSGLR